MVGDRAFRCLFLRWFQWRVCRPFRALCGLGLIGGFFTLTFNRVRSEMRAWWLRSAWLLRGLLPLAPSILIALSNRRQRALLRRVRFHLRSMEAEIPSLLYGGWANPTHEWWV